MIEPPSTCWFPVANFRRVACFAVLNWLKPKCPRHKRLQEERPKGNDHHRDDDGDDDDDDGGGGDGGGDGGDDDDDGGGDDDIG